MINQPAGIPGAVTTVVVPLNKPFYKSWTILFNILSGILVVLNQMSPFASFVFHDPAQARNVSDLISGIIVVINIALRFRTNSKVTLNSK